jgi:hypothetical protein
MPACPDASWAEPIAGLHRAWCYILGMKMLTDDDLDVGLDELGLPAQWTVPLHLPRRTAM